MNKGERNMKSNMVLEQEHKHSNKEHLCFHCNQLVGKENIIKYDINNRGFGSDFDSMKFSIQLCNHCDKELEVEPEWFDNEVCFNSLTGDWLNELYIGYMVEQFPIANQEYIYNCENLLCPSMEREEWLKEYM